MRIAIAMLVLLALSACGSSPKTHFFMLSAAKASADSRAPLAAPVQVTAVHLPPSLDRQEMLLKAQGNSADISDQDRWTAPLDEMTRSVLTEDLSARLPKGMVVQPNAPAPNNVQGIVVSLDRFGPAQNGGVAMKGSWSLVDVNTGKAMAQHDIDFHAQAQGGKGDAVAGAMSGLLGKLADRIASDVSKQPPQHS